MSDILHRVGIDAKPDKVFDALTTLKACAGGGAALHPAAP